MKHWLRWLLGVVVLALLVLVGWPQVQLPGREVSFVSPVAPSLKKAHTLTPKDKITPLKKVQEEKKKGSLEVPVVPRDTPLGSGEAWQVPGLELDAPQKRTRPGRIFVRAKVNAKPEAKIKIIWDVEGVWNDDSPTTEWEIRDDGRRLEIIVPDVSGVIRVSALAIVNGEPTSDKLAKTLIEMNYTPRQSAKPAPRESSKSEGPAEEESPAKATPPTVNKGKLAIAYFVIDAQKGDPTLNDLVAGAGIRNRLRAMGIRPLVFDKDSEEVRRNSLEPYLKDAGGAPALILVTDQRKVRKAIRCPESLEAIMAAVK